MAYKFNRFQPNKVIIDSLNNYYSNLVKNRIAISILKIINRYFLPFKIIFYKNISYA